MIKKPLGGERIGAGKQMSVEMRTYNRSTHNLSTVKRTTMAPGTLVPLYCNFMQTGDTWDGTIRVQMNTLPTNGPLFGSFKFAIDVYEAAIRNYQQWLTNNKFNVGLNMADVKLPQIVLNAIKRAQIDNNQQINASALQRYLGIAGLGTPDNTIDEDEEWTRLFNALPTIVYWDICKNYYFNKQEENAYVIHTGGQTYPTSIADFDTIPTPTTTLILGKNTQVDEITTEIGHYAIFTYDHTVTTTGREAQALQNIKVITDTGEQNITNIYTSGVSQDPGLGNTVLYLRLDSPSKVGIVMHYYTTPNDIPIALTPFPITNIDQMREDLMASGGGTTFTIDKDTYAPYGLPMQTFTDENDQLVVSNQFSQEGIAVKTYQNDILNNWIKTETQQYISDTSAISTLAGQITVDQIVLARKVYDVLNRIAVSGGSYFDWNETIYTSGSPNIATTPMYMGGLIKEIVFQEVVSTAAADTQPLGQIAGRGTFNAKHKGGHVQCKPKEWSIIMAIASITPRIDYSQGNNWWTHLQTMDDFHKPGMDQIGFQDLVTEQMSATETTVDNTGIATLFSAGKQPAWINYMTDINYNYGAFAEPDNEMFMVLNRRYDIDPESGQILDITTYIDPTKYNYIFADTKLDAQNFWIQAGFDWEVRRVISAKQIPNL